MSTIDRADVSLAIRLDPDILDRLDRLTLILRNDPRLAAELGTPGKVTRAELIELFLRDGLRALEQQVLPTTPSAVPGDVRHV